MWNLVFLFTGFLFILLLLIVFLSKKRIGSIENKIFLILALVNSVGYIIELSSQIALRGLEHSNLLVIFTGKLFLIYSLSWIAVFSIYTFLVSRKIAEKDIENTEYYKKIKYTHILIMIVTSLIVLELPIMFYHEGDIIYSYGLSVNFLRIATSIYIFVWLMRLLINFKEIKEKRYYPVTTVILLLFANFVLQGINPATVITNFTLTFICYLMFFTIENPDLKMLNEMILAKNQAEKATLVKTDFLSSMSHEIRTPLNAIIGFSQDLGQSLNLSKEEKDQLNDIKTSSDNLLDIINNILDMNHIESGSLAINDNPYDTNELFNSVANMMKYKIKNKGLSFKVFIADYIPKELLGDKINIKKVITNLLSNAVKYTEQGIIEYDVKCVNKNDICRLIITVTDTGKGIRKEDIDKLFISFERLDDKNTTIEGAGLGLSITKSLLDIMKGDIKVHSEIGIGSRFVVTLEQKIVDKESIGFCTNYVENYSKENEQINDEKIKNKINLSDKKILIVDDNKLNLKVETNILVKYYNAKVDTLSSGKECIDKINNNNKYDLILLDDMMPEMNGIETFKKLKALKNFNTPVVMLTVNVMDGEEEKYLKYGFDYYLSKPVKLEDMNEVLEHFFKDNIEKNKIKEEQNNINNFKDIPKEFYQIENEQDNKNKINFPDIPKEFYQIEEP